MYSLLFIGVVSFLLAMFLTPVVRNLSLRWALVDKPDSARKQHVRAVPRIGGVPLLLAGTGSLALLFLWGTRGSGLLNEAIPSVLAFLPGIAIIFATGLADNIFGLRPWQKLTCQVAAAGAACWAGVSINYIGGYALPQWWNLPLTIVWLVICTNAMNLIDGVDGLATGIGLVAASTTLVAALLQDNFPLAVVTMPLVGALLGFLRYNINPATIFLGDSGSLLIGFLLGSYGVVWSQKSATMLGMTAPMMALAIPLMDTALSVVRRFLSGKPIFGADRGHIHHQLLRRGLTAWRTVLVLYALCGVAAILALAMVNPSPLMGRLVLVVFCAAAWVCVQRLGYVELDVARRVLLGGALRRQVSAQITMEHLEKGLAEADTPERCWEIVSKASRDFGFCGVRLVLAGKTFTYGEVLPGVAIWEANLPLSDHDFVELMRPVEDAPTVASAALYVQMLSKALRSKVPASSQIAGQPREWKVDRRKYSGYYDLDYRRSTYVSKEVVSE